MKYCFALDLKDDDKLIAEYEDYHREIWPEIKESIIKAGIEELEIFRVSNRLFMIMQTNETFSFENKKNIDDANEKVQEWENLMWKYQQKLPFAKEGEKWVLMSKIFQLHP